MRFKDLRPSGESRELWSLRSDVFIENDLGNDALILYNRWDDVVLRHVGKVTAGVLRSMQLGPVSLDNTGIDAADPGSREDLMAILESMQHLIVRTLSTADLDQPLLSLIPITAGAKTRIVPLNPAWPLRLSTFAQLSSDGTDLAVQSPLSLHRVVLHDPETACMTAAATRPRSPAAMAKLLSLPDGLVLDTMAYLAAAGMVVAAESGSTEQEPRFSEDADPALRLWSPTELAFHAYSTLGRHDRDFGLTYWFGKEPQATRTAFGQRRPLYRPSTRRPAESADSGAQRPAGRASPGPPTGEQLGEVLYLGARQTARAAANPHVERALRFYVVVEECAAVEPGVYVYDGGQHALTDMAVPEAGRQALLAQARIAANLDAPVYVVILITVRFGRILWKYSGGGYALALKQTGAAQRDLSRAAGSVDLPAAVIGVSDIEESSRVLSLDWRTEAVLGGLALGRSPRE